MSEEKKSTHLVTVEQIMTSDVFVVKIDMTIKEAIQLLTTKKISGAPVVDQNNHVISVVSEGDLLRLVVGNPMDKKIGQCLDKLVKEDKVVTLKKSDQLKEAYKMFLTHGIHRIIITDSARKLQGILSRSNVLRIFIDQDGSL